MQTSIFSVRLYLVLFLLLNKLLFLRDIELNRPEDGSHMTTLSHGLVAPLQREHINCRCVFCQTFLLNMVLTSKNHKMHLFYTCRFETQQSTIQK